jgi:hypothetical protein
LGSDRQAQLLLAKEGKDRVRLAAGRRSDGFGNGCLGGRASAAKESN